MSKHEFATLASKILAVYFLANAAVSSGTTLMSLIFTLLVTPGPLANGGLVRLLPGSLLAAIVQLLVGLVLWRMAESIAEHMIPTEEEMEEE